MLSKCLLMLFFSIPLHWLNWLTHGGIPKHIPSLKATTKKKSATDKGHSNDNRQVFLLQFIFKHSRIVCATFAVCFAFGLIHNRHYHHRLVCVHVCVYAMQQRPPTNRLQTTAQTLTDKQIMCIYKSK